MSEVDNDDRHSAQSDLYTAFDGGSLPGGLVHERIYNMNTTVRKTAAWKGGRCVVRRLVTGILLDWLTDRWNFGWLLIGAIRLEPKVQQLCPRHEDMDR